MCVIGNPGEKENKGLVKKADAANQLRPAKGCSSGYCAKGVVEKPRA